MTSMDSALLTLGTYGGGLLLVLGAERARQELQVWAARRRRIVPVTEPVDLGEGRDRLLAAVRNPEAFIPAQRAGGESDAR